MLWIKKIVYFHTNGLTLLPQWNSEMEKNISPMTMGKERKTFSLRILKNHKINSLAEVSESSIWQCQFYFHSHFYWLRVYVYMSHIYKRIIIRYITSNKLKSLEKPYHASKTTYLSEKVRIYTTSKVRISQSHQNHTCMMST